MPLPVEIGRGDFLEEIWDYQDGQHVLVVSPTGGGKSELCWQCLAKTMQLRPHLKPLVLMPKHTDQTTAEHSARLGLEETPVWPPQKRLLASPPPGYVLWPPHPHGPGIDTKARREVVGSWLKKGMEDRYWSGNSITFVDDAHSAATMMDLNPLIEEMLVNGRSAHSGVWLATQKPSGTVVSGGLTSFAYNNASKMFFGRDWDERNLQRLSEIGGGTDPKQVKEWVRGLRTWNINGSMVTEWLYVDKGGPYFARILPW